MSTPNKLTDEEMEDAITNDVGLTNDEMAEAAEFERSANRSSVMSSSEDNTLIAGCPQCNSPLNAVFAVHLTGIAIESNGTIRSYDGGPMPESENDIIDLANESDATIVCEQGHVFAPFPIDSQSTNG